MLKSIGEDIKLTVTCPDDKETKVPVTVYVDEIKVIKPKGHTTDIVLDDNMTLRMKYPSLYTVLLKIIFRQMMRQKV